MFKMCFLKGNTDNCNFEHCSKRMKLGFILTLPAASCQQSILAHDHILTIRYLSHLFGKRNVSILKTDYY